MVVKDGGMWMSQLAQGGSTQLNSTHSNVLHMRLRVIRKLTTGLRIIFFLIIIILLFLLTKYSNTVAPIRVGGVPGYSWTIPRFHAYLVISRATNNVGWLATVHRLPSPVWGSSGSCSMTLNCQVGWIPYRGRVARSLAWGEPCLARPPVNMRGRESPPIMMACPPWNRNVRFQ